MTKKLDTLIEKTERMDMIISNLWRCVLRTGMFLFAFGVTVISVSVLVTILAFVFIFLP